MAIILKTLLTNPRSEGGKTLRIFKNNSSIFDLNDIEENSANIRKILETNYSSYEVINDFIFIKNENFYSIFDTINEILLPLYPTISNSLFKIYKLNENVSFIKEFSKESNNTCSVYFFSHNLSKNTIKGLNFFFSELKANYIAKSHTINSIKNSTINLFLINSEFARKDENHEDFKLRYLDTKLYLELLNNCNKVYKFFSFNPDNFITCSNSKNHLELIAINKVHFIKEMYNKKIVNLYSLLGSVEQINFSIDIYDCDFTLLNDEIFIKGYDLKGNTKLIYDFKRKSEVTSINRTKNTFELICFNGFSFIKEIHPKGHIINIYYLSTQINLKSTETIQFCTYENYTYLKKLSQEGKLLELILITKNAIFSSKISPFLIYDKEVEIQVKNDEFLYRTKHNQIYDINGNLRS